MAGVIDPTYEEEIGLLAHNGGEKEWYQVQKIPLGTACPLPPHHTLW